jgi:formylglycine-generating enzyme required for sulfatase activity
MNSTRFCTIVIVLGMVALGLSPVVMADGFGSGANQFEIDFVTISGDTNPTSVYGIVTNDYRMGVYEITNDQWSKFQAELSVPVTGDPLIAYDEESYWTRTDAPASEVSWYEAAQFVNWLNTSTGHQAAYRFTGTQGTGDYTFDIWSPAEADNGTNLYRHKDAFYFLPTEDEWVKAAYWNGSDLQTWATVGDVVPVASADSNYVGSQAWDVGTGSEELNGTFDMMGNVYEWMESPYYSSHYGAGSPRGVRGGSCSTIIPTNALISSRRNLWNPDDEYYDFGFRVASDVPEPATMSLLTLGGIVLLRRK